MIRKLNILKLSFWTLFIRFIGALSGVGLTLIISNVLSVESAGIFFLIFALLNIFARISTAGMGVAILRFSSAYSELKNFKTVNGMLLAAIAVSLIVSMFFSVIFYFFSNHISLIFFNNSDFKYGIKIISISLPFFSTIYTLVGFIQGFKKPIQAVFIENICVQALIIFFIASSFYLSLIVEIRFILNFLFISIFIAFLFAIGLCFKIIISHKPIGLDLTKNRELFSSSKALFVFIAMQLTIQYSSQILSGFYLNSTSVALFVVVQRVAFAVAVIMIIFNQVLAPYISSNFKQDNMKQVQEISFFCSRITVLFSIPIITILLIFNEQILGLFGQEYIAASISLNILLISQMLSITAGNSVMILNMTGYESDTKNIFLFTAFLGILLGLILIPKLGITGAALSTGASLFLQNFIAAIFVYKRHRFNIYKSYL
jgi:O-antigen/teichoic acid export membrane protein